MRIDDVAGDGRALTRRKAGPLVMGEIVVDDDFVAVVAEDQKIPAGLLEVRVEQKSRVRDDDDVAGSRIDLDVGAAPQRWAEVIGRRLAKQICPLR